MDFRERLAVALFGEEFEAEGFYPVKEWELYGSPYKDVFYKMADKVMMVYLSEYGDFLPIGDGNLNSCPVGQENCCGWSSACKAIAELPVKAETSK